MAFVPPARHLVRARDVADARYFEPLDVDDMAAAAGLSRAHFSREFRRAFGDDDMKTLDDLDPAGAHADGRDSTSHDVDRVGEDS